VTLRGIDFRPRTGDLYGVGSDRVVYRVNPRTAIAIGEGPSADVPPGALAGGSIGWDFNPTVDKIRFVSDSGVNARVDPDTGAIVPPGALDKPISPAGARVVGSAYTSSSFSATLPTSTTLYAYDTAADRIAVQAPPNDGVLVQPGVRVRVDLGDEVGFDIAGRSNVGYLAGTPAKAKGARLYRVDVTTGARRTLGVIGRGKHVITGLAVSQAGPTGR
jgi:hypothetical protein